MAVGSFEDYKARHEADVAAGRVMRLPDATLMRRWQGDWSGGLNASEMFRNQGQTLNQAPNPAMYNRAPGSVGVPPSNPVQPQPVGQATTFNGPIASSQMGSLPTGQAVPMAQTGVQAPMAQNSSTGTPYGVNYGDPNRQGSSFGAQRVGTYGSNPSQGSIFGETNIGLAGSENAQTGGLRGALNTVGMGADQARADLTQGGAGANNTLNRYYDPGYKANDYQAALSGALGGQAQQAAFDNFQNSPGQQYLVNESERAIRRNAAATGGLGGANVQRALQENAIGLAAQDFNNSFNRLGQVSDRGLGAGGQMAGNMMNTGSALANLSAGSAANAANMIYGTGRDMGAGRTRAGEMIANNIQSGSQNLANLNMGAGQAMSGVQGQGASQLAGLLAGYGRDDLQANTQLATLLANLATGTGTQVAGLPTLGQPQQTSGIVGNPGEFGQVVGGVGSAIGMLGALSDPRLKTNVERIGTVNGYPWYSWDWTEEGLALAGDQPTEGVMATEVPSQYVSEGEDGYLRVNYEELLNA
jgi:hypothetical protein